MTRTLDVSIVLGPPPSWKSPIKLEQLAELAKNRSDVALREAETGTRAKKDIVVVDPNGAVPGGLLFIDGRLQIRNPSDSTLQWMLELAEELGGRVSDNTGRTYRTPQEKYIHPDDEEARGRLASSIRDARKIDRAPPIRKRRWFGLWVTLFALQGVGGDIGASIGSVSSGDSSPALLRVEGPQTVSLA